VLNELWREGEEHVDEKERRRSVGEGGRGRGLRGYKGV
jgi:hypothetical protein